MKRFIPGLLVMAALAGACGPKPETVSTTPTDSAPAATSPAPASPAVSETVAVPPTTESPAPASGMESPAPASPGSSPASGEGEAAGMESPDAAGGDTASPAAGPPPAGTQKALPSGVKYTEMTAGTGTTAESGKRVSVHYTGWLTNGEKFDSSLDRKTPFDFTLGAGEVIPGWDEGVKGMKVGEKRRLEIPPDQGYGAEGAPGAIPPNATLIFEVELLGIQ